MKISFIERFYRDVRRIQDVIAEVDSRAIQFDVRLIGLILVLEDKRFWRHAGVDLKAAARAFAHFSVGRPRGGASTIDMQLARTVTGYRARTPFRKLYECALAIALRRRAPAESILTAYLAVAYFGSSVTGADAAASRLFGRGVEALSLEECAEVAALLVHPIPQSFRQDWREKVKLRAAYGVSRLNVVEAPVQVYPN